jgi:hypothetical protein
MFISYRRSDATPVAQGLHEAFIGRGYRVFLDTASVEAGARLQDVLWDRLADMDLLILLDSPHALTSRWVNDELTRVNQLGLGVLQLIWPSPHRRSRGTELSEPFDLMPADFVAGNAGPDDQLTETALARVTARAEEVRIRSLSARRARVVNELLDRADQLLYRPDVYPMGPITLRARDAGAAADAPILGVAIPLIGLPDAWSIHQVEKQIAKLLEYEDEDQEDRDRIKQLLEQGGVRIVFDGLGVQSDHTEHYSWLNGHLVLKTSHFDRPLGPQRDPLDDWLTSLRANSAGGMP